MSILNRGHARHGVVIPKIAPISGRYYSTRDGYGGTAGASTLGASLYAVPFYSPTTFVADRLACNVTVAGAAGKLARIGLYAATAGGAPGALLVDSGALAVDGATGVREVTISQQIVAGVLYFFAFSSDGAPTLTVTTATRDVFGATDASSGAIGALTRTFAYAALPDPWGTPAFYSGTFPHISLRAT